MTTERTEGDYAEIMEALRRFEGKRVQLSYSFPDGTKITGVQDVTEPATVFRPTCRGLRQPFETAADAQREIFDLPGAVTLHVCPALTVEVWDEGFRMTGHNLECSATLIEP